MMEALVKHDALLLRTEGHAGSKVIRAHSFELSLLDLIRTLPAGTGTSDPMPPTSACV